MNGIDYTFNIQQNELSTPKYIDYNKFNIDTTLSARALSSLVTQLAGIISAATEKQRKRIYILDQMKHDGKNKASRSKLVKKIKQNIPQKPNVKNLNPELSSKCCSWLDANNYFNGFLKMSALLKDTKAIYIPIKMHKHSNKLMNDDNGKMMTSFLITESHVNIRWDIPKKELKTIGDVVGADQGAKTCLTLSDNQATTHDIHGHTLDSIMKRLSGKKKGSKSFRRTQKHRENYINWSLKQLDFSNIREIRLERIWNIGYKNNKSRFLSHFTNTLIRDKVEQLALENGVHFVEQDSTYRSQRCSGCGLVRKANRKGKLYICNCCGNIMDADLNAAMNHSIDLPEVPYTLRKKNFNRGNDGFYWKPDGFFDFSSGRSLESLPPVEDI